MICYQDMWLFLLLNFGFVSLKFFSPNSSEWGSRGGPVLYQFAKKKWPNVSDDALFYSTWHVKETLDFWKSFWNHYSKTLARDPAAQKQFADNIKKFLAYTHNIDNIKYFLGTLGPAYGNIAISYVYPELGEWWQEWRIQNDISAWLKDVTSVYKNIKTEAGRTTYQANIKRQLQAYGLDNWAEGVDKEIVAGFVANIMAEEVQEIQAAQAVEVSERGKKVMLLAVGGGVALFALSAMFKKR